MGLSSFIEHGDDAFMDSMEVMRPLVERILTQDPEGCPYPRSQVSHLRKAAASRREVQGKNRYEMFLKSDAPEDLRRRVQLAAEDGVSTWLSALPIEDHGLHHPRTAWEDVIAVRYGLPLHDVPNECGCGSTFGVAHQLQCPLGGFINGRHNDLRDWFLELLQRLYPDVRKEPSLKDLTHPPGPRGPGPPRRPP